MKAHALTALLLLAAAATAVHADPPAASKSSIVIEAPWLRATPKGAPVAGGYVTITNRGMVADRLIGASLPMAPKGEIHSMSMQDGVMHMERLDKGLPIAPGATVSLTPGGYHMMFIHPKVQLMEGQTIKGTLTFEKAGTIPVAFPVAGFAAKSAPGAPAGSAVSGTTDAKGR